MVTCCDYLPVKAAIAVEKKSVLLMMAAATGLRQWFRQKTGKTFLATPSGNNKVLAMRLETKKKMIS